MFQQHDNQYSSNINHVNIGREFPRPDCRIAIRVRTDQTSESLHSSRQGQPKWRRWTRWGWRGGGWSEEKRSDQQQHQRRNCREHSRKQVDCWGVGPWDEVTFLDHLKNLLSYTGENAMIKHVIYNDKLSTEKNLHKDGRISRLVIVHCQ